MKVMIVVTHLLGTGHLARALVLARAIQAAGAQAVVVSGGMPVPHLDRGDVAIEQLAPLRSDGVDFARLLDKTGHVATDTHYGARRAMLAQSLARMAPDVLITELFPFGRRSLKDEFLHLLEQAKALPKVPLICASIRDILAPPSKPAKATYAEDMLAQFYDGVLVHSDPELTPLELSWPMTAPVDSKLHYTGFVAPPAPTPHPARLGQDEILVSAGGGDVGDALFETALAAAAQTPRCRWRLLVGGGPARLEHIQTQAAANVLVQPPQADFRSMLFHAKASVSMCGYNTALDILQTGCRAVFIPFDAGGEVEQTLRATALSAHPGIATLTSQSLTPQRLISTLDHLNGQPSPRPKTEGFDGAARSVTILRTLLESHR